jgi:hypothetical protein
MPDAKTPIRPREREAVLRALRAGVVPHTGIQHVQVGRKREVEQIIADVALVADGGSAVRFCIGEYGSGKTFFLSLVRSVAMQHKLVVLNADLSPDRRIHATGGQARSLCAELVRSMSTRACPDGNALRPVMEKFLETCRAAAATSGSSVDTEIRRRLATVQAMLGGYDFATVALSYLNAAQAGDDEKQEAALRWLRGEYTLKSEAREALGVRTIVSDADVYDHLKALSCFVRAAGFSGMLVILDEMVNLLRLVNAQARNANYEQLLRIVNDSLQGSGGTGFYFGGTPEFLSDTRRGMYSYEALKSRLAENRFATDGRVDLTGPVLRLQNLTPEELLVLLGKLRDIQGGIAAAKTTDDALVAFLDHCNRTIGETYFRTPRNTIKAFLDMLAIVEQNHDIAVSDLIGKVEIGKDVPAAAADVVDSSPGSEDALASFRL